jgi:7-cyano-7-deazaguanine synthase
MNIINGIAILSGGMDSATALALAEYRGLTIKGAVWFDYGQRHAIEYSYAKRLADHFDVQLHEMTIPTLFAKNQLTDLDQTPRANTPMREITQGVAPTFVPGRNMVMLSLAAAFAVSQDCNRVVGGWHWDDSSGYPDCRASFLTSMQATIHEALGSTEFIIVRPLISMSKGQIVSEAISHGVPLERTWSCYSPVMEGEQVLSCGVCDTCQLRIKGFIDAGYIDPIKYAIPLDWEGCESI